MKLSRVSVRVLVAAAFAASAAVAIGVPTVGASTAQPPSIPPASLWAINETARTYGIRTISLPSAYVFASWHQQASNVPEHRGRDMVVEFSRDGRSAAATWTATRVYPHELSRCGSLYGSSSARSTMIRAHAVYSTKRQRDSIAWMCVTDTPYYPMIYQLRADHLSRSELTSIVGNSRYRYAYTVSPFVDFWTPSHNIGCLASVPGQGLDPGTFTCYIRSGLRPAPPTHRIAECRVGFGWGSIVWLDLPQGLGQYGTSAYGCSDYAPVDPSAPTLDYGQSIRFSGATCTSMRVGLRCSNGRHGFFLSRQHSYLF